MLFELFIERMSVKPGFESVKKLSTKIQDSVDDY